MCCDCDYNEYDDQRVEFTFSLEDAGDHYILDDSTQFPSSRINKPASPTVVREMIAARIVERAQLVANELTQPVDAAEIRHRLDEIITHLRDVSNCWGSDIADAILAEFDVRVKS